MDRHRHRGHAAVRPAAGQGAGGGRRPRRGGGRAARRPGLDHRRRRRDQPRVGDGGARRPAVRRRRARDPDVRGPAVPPADRSRCWRPPATSRCRTGPAGSATGPSACRPADRWTTARSAWGTGRSGTPRAPPASSARCTGPPCASTGPRSVCLAGADMGATLDGEPVDRWNPVPVAPGQTLRCGPVAAPGARGYVLLAGGVDVPEHLGSRATFTLGGFGGHAGRALRPGDLLRLGDAAADAGPRAGAGARGRAAAAGRPLGRARATRGRTPTPSSSPPRAPPPSPPPRGPCTTTRPAPASAWSARSPSGRAPTAARRACTPRTSTTRPTRSARSTSPATCP